MKKFNQDSTSALSRFSRDKRTLSASAEKVERTSRPRREADNEGRQTYGRSATEGRFSRDNRRSEGRNSESRRSSFNPNFSADNRPIFREERGYSERSERNYSGSSFAERSSFSERSERPARGGKSFGKPAGKSGRKPSFKADERNAGYRSEYKGGFKAENKGGRKPFRKSDEKPSYPKYAAKQTGAIRLNRFLAQSGLCSRREADDFITAGLVTVNGVIVTELGTKVMPSDEVKFNDEKVQGEKKVYLVLNKPKGYVTSLEDPHADKTVMELVKGACSERIYPVGRLDKNSLGLLLFTNDGDVTRQLTHPSHEKKKIYQVTLDKPLTKADMEQITEGITLEDGEIYADEVAYVGDTKKEIGIEIHSGRNRIVRRIFEHLGYTVQKLDRVYYAGITKKNLKRGAWRFLTNDEVNRLKSGRYE